MMKMAERKKEVNLSESGGRQFSHLFKDEMMEIGPHCQTRYK
jgi:hypothetical protein